MTRYIVTRLLSFVPTLLAVAVLLFLLLDMAPGDPVIWMLGREAGGEAIAEKRHELGLDRPAHERLVMWLGQVARGDLGQSLFLGQSVKEALAERYPVTLSVTGLALLVAVTVGVPVGVFCAVNQGQKTDWVSMAITLIVMSLPSFWLGLNMIYLFGVALKWFPTAGYVPFHDGAWPWLKRLVLPCLSLGLGSAAWIARMSRSSMLEVLRMEYVRTARSKGLKERSVVFGHAFRNAAIPILTTVGMSAAGLIAGSVVTETVFALPGLGRLVVDAVSRRDYLVIQGAILVIMFFELLLDLGVDVLYVWIDPRVRYHR